jgi:dihydrofolate synthase/folylpolyglutamate synthase
VDKSSVLYLFSLERLGIKLGLEQIRGLVDALGRPDHAYPSIVVAGTNGKGSVVAMVERGLRAAGHRTGRFTSPHLVMLQERFAIDGRPIDSRDLDRLAGRVRTAAETLAAPPTFFEATTALALEAFREAAVDVAVLEVGLGGRLDATNVVTPLAVAITAIDFDHQELLGPTIDAIAREKAGVIKPGAVVVLAANPPVVRDIVQEACAAAGARFVDAAAGVAVRADMTGGRARLTLETPCRRYDALTLALRGRHQIDNAIAAIRLLEEMPRLKPRPTSPWPAPPRPPHDGVAPSRPPLPRPAQPSVGPGAIRAAVEAVEWPGRLQLVDWRGHGVEVLIDGAHNPAGARALASYVTETYGRPLPFVVGILRDKPLAALLAELAPVASHFVVTAPDTPRAAAPSELAAAARGVVSRRGIPVIDVPRPVEALGRAATFGSPIVVAGSLYLAGEILAEIS